MVFHFFELLELPKEINENNILLLLLSLLKAETEEELEMIKALEVPVMCQAIDTYYTITTSSEFREREHLRPKARHDEAQALHNAELRSRQGERIEFALKLKRNRPVEEIIEDTGLTREEIESLPDYPVGGNYTKKRKGLSM